GLPDLSVVLARAREQDITLRALESYQQTVNEETRLALQPLLEVWQQERKDDRAACTAYLGSERHAAWLRELSTFVKSNAGDRPQRKGQPYYLRHTLDLMVADALTAVRAY